MHPQLLLFHDEECACCLQSFQTPRSASSRKASLNLCVLFNLPIGGHSILRVSDRNSTSPKDGEVPGSHEYGMSVERTRDAQYGGENV